MPLALLDTGESSSTLPDSEAESKEEEINGKIDKFDRKHTYTDIDLQMGLRCRQTPLWIVPSFPRRMMILYSRPVDEAGIKLNTFYT